MKTEGMEIEKETMKQKRERTKNVISDDEMVRSEKAVKNVTGEREDKPWVNLSKDWYKEGSKLIFGKLIYTATKTENIKTAIEDVANFKDELKNNMKDYTKLVLCILFTGGRPDCLRNQMWDIDERITRLMGNIIVEVAGERQLITGNDPKGLWRYVSLNNDLKRQIRRAETENKDIRRGKLEELTRYYNQRRIYFHKNNSISNTKS